MSIVLSSFLVGLIILVLFMRLLSRTDCVRYNTRCPRLIHMIYIPWNRDQTLKEDEDDFDKGPYETMKRRHPDFEVRLWKRSSLDRFLRLYYPQYRDRIWSVRRPVMTV
ncbi:MAG: hypothetical protein EBS91_10790, partial [Betaproteobacteria bacterium]|nr:hypothetical protein [Betaproteobacteria bacterium]